MNISDNIDNSNGNVEEMLFGTGVMCYNYIKGGAEKEKIGKTNVSYLDNSKLEKNIDLTKIGEERQATIYARYIVDEYAETREHP